MRQWVLSVPFDLRALVATKPDVRTAVGAIFAEEIARAKKRLANVDGAEMGVMSCHQNFGGSLNAHAHGHDVAIVDALSTARTGAGHGVTSRNALSLVGLALLDVMIHSASW